MIIFNTTFHIDESTDHEWLNWMQKTYIPLLMETGLFTHHYFCRVMVEEEMGGRTYSLQMFLKNMDHYSSYQDEFAHKMQAVLQAKFANRVLSFSTLLQQI